MEMKIQLSGKKSVTALFDGFKVITDQPREDGGDGIAPAPFELFLASMGTCAGFFIQSFCQTRGIATDGIEITQRSTWNKETHLVSRIAIEVSLPSDFPEKYRSGLIHAANLCTVKRHFQSPPEIAVSITTPTTPLSPGDADAAKGK